MYTLHTLLLITAASTHSLYVMDGLPLMRNKDCDSLFSSNNFPNIARPLSAPQSIDSTSHFSAQELINRTEQNQITAIKKARNGVLIPNSNSRKQQVRFLKIFIGCLSKTGKDKKDHPVYRMCQSIHKSVKQNIIYNSNLIPYIDSCSHYNYFERSAMPLSLNQHLDTIIQFAVRYNFTDTFDEFAIFYHEDYREWFNQWDGQEIFLSRLLISVQAAYPKIKSLIIKKNKNCHYSPTC